MINACRRDGLMSTCSCGGTVEQCSLSEKSSYNSHCMYWRFEEYCDNSMAQAMVGAPVVCPEYSVQSVNLRTEEVCLW
jgi:hypothetical protein